ncbi:MAG: RagB/SusD family nutrient uptake outer membrane protein [Prevotella sp.]
MKNRILVTAIIGILMVSSCDDYLTESPKHSYITDNAIVDSKSATNAINGMYGKYEECTTLGGYIYGSLHCMAGFWDYDDEMYDMGYTQTSDHYIISSIWQELYGVIDACNFAIGGIEKLDDSCFTSAEEKQALIAEARGMRGYANLELMWLFAHWFDKADSPYGIIYRSEVAELSNLMVERATVGESYQYILDDLMYAEEYAPDYTSAHRVNKQFAKAMHAKLLLVRGWEGDYVSSLKIVNDLLADKTCEWQMENDVTELYDNGWESKENVFSHYLGDMEELYYTSYCEYIYSYALYYYDNFHTTAMEWIKEDARYDLTYSTAKAPQARDKTSKDGIMTKLYHRGRYYGINDMYATYPMRYAELYLMKAELLARTNPNDISGALAPINEMRNNYTNPILSPVTGVTNHSELMDVIFKEYVVTLFMENETPWFASLRFEYNGKPWIYTLKPEISFNSNQYCWPIPDAEIKSHNNIIEQNPGLE